MIMLEWSESSTDLQGRPLAVAFVAVFVVAFAVGVDRLTASTIRQPCETTAARKAGANDAHLVEQRLHRALALLVERRLHTQRAAPIS